MTQQQADTTKARIVRDARDGRKDYFIPIAEAQRLYNEGKLAIDVTNHCFMELTANQ
jgi:hypothetical protein